MKLNLGCGADVRPGYVNVDLEERPGVDVAWDFGQLPWPWPDQSVDEILALNVLEHVDMNVVWNEIYRILKTQGTITIEVSDGEWGDPFHLSTWSHRSIYACCSGYGIRGGKTPAYRRVGRIVWRHAPSGFPWWHLWHLSSGRIPLPPLPFGPRLLRFTLEKL